MKKRYRAIGCGIAVLAVVIPLGIILRGPLLFFVGGMWQIRSARAFLLRPQVYEPVAQTLPLYCQSDPELIPQHIGYAWFPAPLREKYHGWGTITPADANIEWGGGFHHFGYRMDLDEAASTPTARVWHLYFCEEDVKDILLQTVTVPPSAKLSADEIVARLVAAFDSRLVEDPGDNGARRGKILSLFHYGKPREALQACDEWIAVQPDSWLPRFAKAHTRCRLGEADAAATEFTAWVESHKSFNRCLGLALFNMREGRSEPALAAIRSSLDQPFAEPPDPEVNQFGLGYNGAVFALSRKDYTLCLALCDKMLADKRQDDYLRSEIMRLKTAAEHKNVAQFLPDYAKKNENDLGLYTPFDSRVNWFTGLSGIPSVYPENWKENVGF